MLRICPSVPITWRGRGCLQFGVEDPVLIDGLLPAEASLIEDLRMGLASAQFHHRAQELGIDLARATSLISLLAEADVLIPSDSDTSAMAKGSKTLSTARLFRRTPDETSEVLAARTVAVLGPLRSPVAHQLSLAGFAVSTASRVDESEALAHPIVVTTSHLVPDLHSATWLVDREIDHCQVVAGEFTVTLTGLVRPGRTPCTLCGCLSLRDADADWFDQYPRIRALQDRDELSDPLAAGVAATHIALVLRRALLEDAAEPMVRSVDLRTGFADEEDLAFHPRCHCRAPVPRFGRPEEAAQ